MVHRIGTRIIQRMVWRGSEFGGCWVSMLLYFARSWYRAGAEQDQGVQSPVVYVVWEMR